MLVRGKVYGESFCQLACHNQSLIHSKIRHEQMQGNQESCTIYIATCCITFASAWLGSQISRRQDGEGAIMGFIVHDTAKQVIGIADVNLGITLFFTKLEHILVPSLLKENRGR